MRARWPPAAADPRRVLWGDEIVAQINRPSASGRPHDLGVLAFLTLNLHRHHHVLDGVQVWNQIECLEDETDFLLGSVRGPFRGEHRSKPPYVIVPAVGRINPPILNRRVVFPDPEPPVIVANSPYRSQGNIVQSSHFAVPALYTLLRFSMINIRIPA